MVKHDNKFVLIDGTRYEMSQMQYNKLQKFLSGLHLANNVRESAPAKPAVPTPTKLTDAMVKNLIGHTNVVYYNFETNAWNTYIYNGVNITDQDIDTEYALEFKKAMAKEPKFTKDYEMAATVTMTISATSYQEQKNLIAFPQYKSDGTAIIGNIIVKNKKTGKYELYANDWVCAHKYYQKKSAAINGAYTFANSGAWDPAFRAALIAAHTR